MTLFASTLITGMILAILGFAVAFRWEKLSKPLQAFPRSKNAALITMTIGGVWFLSHILKLGFADFGQYRNYLFVGFAALGLASFRYAPDFLAVRGLSIIILLSGGTILDSAYRQEPTSRLLLVSITYVLIAIAIWLGSNPYKMRDFLSWMAKSSKNRKMIGYLSLIYGLTLTFISFTY